MTTDDIPTILGTLLATLVGVWPGYRLSKSQSERHYRRTIIRAIALEYRQLARERTCAGISGLLRAGVQQCQDNKEYRQVLDLIDDLDPKIPTGTDWRPSNGDYHAFFSEMRSKNMDPTNSVQMLELKKEIERS